MALSEAEMKAAFGQQTSLASMESTFVNRAKNEVVRYYRHPDVFAHPKFPNGYPNERAGWISCGDSQDSKFILMTRRGFQQVTLTMEDGSPLRIIDEDPNFRRYGKYGPLLAHPQGPALIPITQILDLRWYRPEQCPIPEVHERFPALIDYLKENRLQEFNCPECQEIYVLNPVDLARHLRYRHQWTRDDIRTLGEELDVNFSQVFAKPVIEDIHIGATPVTETKTAVPIEQTEVKTRRAPGRPKGSKNKPRTRTRTK